MARLSSASSEVCCALPSARAASLDLLTQLLQIVGEAGFGRIGEVAAAQPIRTALHAGAEIVFVHAVERAAQLAGRRRLRGRELARRGAHLLREARQVVAHLLAIVDHFVDFLRRKGTFGGLPAARAAFCCAIKSRT